MTRPIALLVLRTEFTFGRIARIAMNIEKIRASQSSSTILWAATRTANKNSDSDSDGDMEDSKKHKVHLSLDLIPAKVSVDFPDGALSLMESK